MNEFSRFNYRYELLCFFSSLPVLFPGCYDRMRFDCFVFESWAFVSFVNLLLCLTVSFWLLETLSVVQRLCFRAALKTFWIESLKTVHRMILFILVSSNIAFLLWQNLDYWILISSEVFLRGPPLHHFLCLRPFWPWSMAQRFLDTSFHVIFLVAYYILLPRSTDVLFTQVLCHYSCF